MLKSHETVKYTMEAIESVKARAKEALDAGNNKAYFELMGDLMTLEMCLVGDTKALLNELEAMGKVVPIVPNLKLLVSK